MINRDSASLNTTRTVSPFSHEPTETQLFVHKRARYKDFDRDDDAGSLVELKKKIFSHKNSLINFEFSSKLTFQQ